MKRVFRLFLAIGAFLFMISPVNATETKDLQGIFEECGLGAAIFRNWALGASISNFTWDYGITATTSGLTTPESCMGGRAYLVAYIFHSYDSIEQDLAKGHGKYLDMLAVLTDKQRSQKVVFVSSLREGFVKAMEQREYSSLNHIEKVAMLYTIVEQSV